MIATLTIPKTMNFVADRIVPQNSMQAQSLPASAKWLAADREKVDSVIQKKVVGHATSYLPPDVEVISAMRVYALK